VKKKDSSLRICVDYRQLNQKPKKDAYALPRIEESLDCLAGNQYFSVIDMKSGFHQVEILEEHKERTIFTVGPLGLYEYIMMPFWVIKFSWNIPTINAGMFVRFTPTYMLYFHRRCDSFLQNI
jgi:hypothetical protein